MGAKPATETLEEGEIGAARDGATVSVVVTNLGQRPVQVGSHLHFFEVDGALSFERWKAYGRRLDIAPGTALRFAPGQQRTVALVRLGKRPL
ncbi:urease subunit beta [Massilia endophytica]|uniref:urease subunit beta n=1 Tax=Massilia endophytica TaxID=2899220 RepID=UPI001E62BA17|nr:urease subunit beta [Massilia endophytica]UGQ48261.1 urease subunit beta [Massilia endophytica]